jgi:hypothetical protein
MTEKTERGPDYRAAAAWSGFLVLIGAVAFALGMAVHYEAHAKEAPHPASLQRQEGSEEHLMAASNQIFLVRTRAGRWNY